MYGGNDSERLRVPFSLSTKPSHAMFYLQNIVLIYRILKVRQKQIYRTMHCALSYNIVLEESLVTYCTI